MSIRDLLTPAASATVLAGLILMTACAPRTEWVKEEGGGDGAALRQDREACLKESGDAGFVLGQASQDAETSARDRHLSGGQGQIYRLCMQSRGWVRRPVKPGS